MTILLGHPDQNLEPLVERSSGGKVTNGLEIPEIYSLKGPDRSLFFGNDLNDDDWLFPQVASQTENFFRVKMERHETSSSNEDKKETLSELYHIKQLMYEANVLRYYPLIRKRRQLGDQVIPKPDYNGIEASIYSFYYLISENLVTVRKLLCGEKRIVKALEDRSMMIRAEGGREKDKRTPIKITRFITEFLPNFLRLHLTENNFILVSITGVTNTIITSYKDRYIYATEYLNFVETSLEKYLRMIRDNLENSYDLDNLVCRCQLIIFKRCTFNRAWAKIHLALSNIGIGRIDADTIRQLKQMIIKKREEKKNLKKEQKRLEKKQKKYAKAVKKGRADNELRRVFWTSY